MDQFAVQSDAQSLTTPVKDFPLVYTKSGMSAVCNIATDTLGFVVVFIGKHHRPLSSPSLLVMMSPQLTVA